MDELLRDFLVETGEHVEAAGAHLVRFEREPSDGAMIAAIFRLLHTIKGTCGFLGLPRLARLAHAAESVLGALREGAPATPAAITLILSAMDRIRFLLAEIERLQREPDGDDEDLVGALGALVSALGAAAAPAPAAALPTSPEPAPSAGPAPSAEPAPDAARDAAGPRERRGAGGSVRVAVDSLERIMALVSELVLTRNQLAEIARRAGDATLEAALQRLSSIATDLQDSVMRARMQPLDRLFGALPRLVRELAHDLDKDIDLVVEGAATELDRQLIEVIRDPLTHLVRNCADHGLESPAERLAAGKPACGRIRVAASQTAGQITIEIGDDGRGLDAQRIGARARALGLVDEATLAAMREHDVHRFIFAPGFSTAKTVTAISGRGVGLDIVRDSIESIGGSVSLDSTPGQGLRFVIRIPLTLAIAPALIVSAGGQRFALPQTAVVEVVSVEAGSPHRIERVQSVQMLRLRDDMLPLVDLAAQLGLRDPATTPGEDALVAVMRVAGGAFGLIVDRVDDVQEIVVKPIGALLSHLAVYSGQTILGDGAVVLILDPAGVAGTLGLHRQAASVAPAAPAPAGAAKTHVVVFRAGPGALKALPLSLIARIETVPGSDVADVCGVPTLRRDGKLIPLALLHAPFAPAPEQAVLVLDADGRHLGLPIDAVVDIVEEAVAFQTPGDGRALLGSATLGGHVVEVVDVSALAVAAWPDLAAPPRAARRVLLVDDRRFFRDMLTPILTAAGYAVTACASPDEALAAAAGPAFDAIVTDAQFPQIDGAAFLRRLRAAADPAPPIIVLSSHSAPPQNGVAAVCGKFDRRGLVAALERLFDAPTDVRAAS